MTWTFKIKQGLIWSDGNPVTAADWVATFQYAADPEHAWDFTWFFQGVIKDWNDVIAGEACVDKIGVAQRCERIRAGLRHRSAGAVSAGHDALFAPALEGGAGRRSGPLYNTKPETAVSSGPFMLRSGRRISRSSTSKQPEVHRHDQVVM